MDPLNRYRQAVERVLTEYAAISLSYGEIETQRVFDRESDHYLLMLVGSDGDERVHGCLVHVDIKGGKCWIQRDGTEKGIAQELLNAGVASEDIVLAFRLPDFKGEAPSTMASVQAAARSA
jgi:hypothetical protein